MEFVRYQFLSTAPCLTQEELEQQLCMTPGSLFASVEKLASNRQLYDSLLYYVRVYQATGRHLLPDGSGVQDPQSVRVRVLRDFHPLQLQAGQVVEMAYSTAVQLVNERMVEFSSP